MPAKSTPPPSSQPKTRLRSQMKATGQRASGLAPSQQQLLDTLRDKILDEIDATTPGWGGTGVQIDRYENPVSVDHKRDVQAQGAKYGCHTCPSGATPLALDTDQAWIGDHIPPTNLENRVRQALGVGNSLTVLYPQCDSCAEDQSTLVRRLNLLQGQALTQAIALLSAKERRLLTGGQPTVTHAIASTGPRVNQGQGGLIQDLGTKHGCHSCDSVNFHPKSKFHADHCPPVLLHQPTAQAIMDELGIARPSRYEAKPQCPRCSNAQGGALSRVKRLLSSAADLLDMPNYWKS